MAKLDDLATPTVLVDRIRLGRNIESMQAACDAARVELRPHIKSHKMVAIGRMQLAAGAKGFTCAKLGEAEALLPSGVRRIFVAYSLVDPRQAPRIAALAESLDEFCVAATSAPQAEALDRVAGLAGRKLPVILAVDTGLGREGARTLAEARALAASIARSSHLELRGFYTHEGHLYSALPSEEPARFDEVIGRLCAVRDAIDPSLPVWPGCSVDARQAVASGRVQAVRPGAYVFGDLTLTRLTGAMRPDDAALQILVTVVDRPEPGLALIDSGSKTLSGDKTREGAHAACALGRDLTVVRVNEEHGYLRGAEVDALRVGDRLRLVPAHVCPVVNLTDQVTVIEGDNVVGTWPVEARGRVR